VNLGEWQTGWQLPPGQQPVPILWPAGRQVASSRGATPSTPPQESLDVIAATIGAALAAAVPPGVTRTVYLCDDGKDAKKAAYIASLGPAAK
jgi:hypothetical protein